MPSLASPRIGRRGLIASTAAALAVVAAVSGCTRSTVLESDAPPRSTTTTMGIRPVPNGGTELPDAPGPTDTTTPAAGSGPTTTAARPVTSVKSSTTTKTPKTTRPAATPTTRAPTANATASGAPKVVTTTTTTPPPPSSTTTTTSLPVNPAGIVATVNPSIAVQGSTQAFQYALSDPQSGPVPTLSACAGTDYVLGSSGGYVLAPFQSTLDCSNPGEVLRTLPADAPLGIYDLCVTINGQSAVVCTPYYVINFSTSFH